MTEEERQFPDVLAEAQKAGYAEADPTFDIEGIDSAHKLAILVNLAFGTNVKPGDIYTEGISSIRPIDIDFGKEFGYKLKLLAIAKSRDRKVEVRVHPTMVPDEYPIAKVQGVYNAIQIVGDACQDIMLYGRGAGSLPTGSAVVADIIEIGREILKGSRPVPASPDSGAQVQIQPIENILALYYLRFMVFDRPGVLSQISGIFGQYNISIASVIQRGRKEGSAVPLVIMTHTALERDMRKALIEIKRLACISEEPVLIRVEGEER
jgi:homoserine dehydrogenase